MKLADIRWLYGWRCSAHSMDGISHYPCFLREKPLDSPFQERVGIFDLETSGLNADFAYIFCVGPETLVLTADLRWKRAKEIARGEDIIGVNEFPGGSKRGEKRRLLKTRVVATEVVYLPRIKVVTPEGEIVVSDKHRFLVYSPHTGGYQWKPAEELKVGDGIRFIDRPWISSWTWHEGWLAGIADGEGCVVKGKRRGNSRLDIAQSVKQGLDKVIEKELRQAGYKFTKSTGKTKVVNFRLFSRDLLRFLGALRPARLLAKFDKLLEEGWLGLPVNPSYSIVSQLIPIDAGEPGPVCTIQTAAHTLITNGFVSHNSYAILDDTDGRVYGRVLTPHEVRSSVFDKSLVVEMCRDLKKFNRIVVHYGGDRRFDAPFARTRAIKYGCDFPLYKDIWVTDTWLMSKNKLKLRSNRLAVICEFFGIEAKTHPLTPDVWQTASAGNGKSLEFIWTHNVEDVTSTRKVYHLLEGYVAKSKTSI